jgi:hypothetical protein
VARDKPHTKNSRNFAPTRVRFAAQRYMALISLLRFVPDRPFIGKKIDEQRGKLLSQHSQTLPLRSCH